MILIRTKVYLNFVKNSASSFVIKKFSIISSPRVVVTGLGLVCPLGVGVEYAWSRILKGECGISNLPQEKYQNIPCQVAAFVPRGLNQGELNFENFQKSEVRNMSLASLYSLIAAKEAVEDANWHPETENDKNSTGVAVGMGVPDLEDITDTGCNLREKGYRTVNPYFVTKTLVNIPAGYISMKYNCQGPNHAVSTACTTGVHAVGDAFNFIRKGDASVMICGSTEAVIGPLSIVAFSKMRALSTSFNSDPQKSSRPFDKKRDGFVMGEGAGIIILETLEHAKERNAKIYAEILGYGLSGDAHHITAPREDGNGAYRCMAAALKDAKIDLESIFYINAHATSTPQGDKAEISAIKKLFGRHAEKLAISSTKGAIGHLLGAAGSVETIFTILSCYRKIIPPTINLEESESQFKNLNFVPNKCQLWPEMKNYKDNKRIALTNSFGFGGTNATLVISSF